MVPGYPNSLSISRKKKEITVVIVFVCSGINTERKKCIGEWFGIFSIMLTTRSFLAPDGNSHCQHLLFF